MSAGNRITGGALPVSALTSDTVACVAADATLHEVADALVAGDVGALVVGEPDRVEGVVSERDVVRALANRRDPSATVAADLANTDVIWTDAAAHAGDVAALMMDKYVRHVLVRDQDRLAGIVSARDLLGAYVAADEDVS